MFYILGQKKDQTIDREKLKEDGWDYLEDFYLEEFEELDAAISQVGYYGDSDRYSQILIFDETSKEIYDYTNFSWANRDQFSGEKAMMLLTVRVKDAMSTSTATTRAQRLEDADEYAKSKGIPFSSELQLLTINAFESRYPYWNSSSAMC